jgi:hypothetical protein
LDVQDRVKHSKHDLFDPDQFVRREGRPQWVMVAANTSWHYKEHEVTLADWLERLNK